MKTLIFILLLSSTSMAQQQPWDYFSPANNQAAMDAHNIFIQQQQVEIQNQQLQLQQQQMNVIKAIEPKAWVNSQISNGF